jgi:NAD(P)-dependent dehydrogenase (short-subunit alcohol dehydrogenase family)
VPFDLRNVEGFGDLLASAQSSLGDLSVLAHCAAVLRRRDSVDEVTVEEWDLQHDVNLRATFFLNRAVAREYRAHGLAGRIINLASQAWWTGGLHGAVPYAATKGGIVALTRGLARSFAADDITVNCVAPGAVDSPMLHADLTDAQLADLVAQIPLARLARPEEIASAVVFLASVHASYITGATLNVSGGQLMY